MKRVALCVCVLALLAASGASIGRAAPATPTAATPAPATPTAAKKQTDRVLFYGFNLEFDGDAEESWSVGPKGFAVAPRGAFLIVHLVARNIGSEPASFPFVELREKDNQGRTFEPDKKATLLFVADKLDFLMTDHMQPGLDYRIAVVFDVPMDVTDFSLSTSTGAFAAR